MAGIFRFDPCGSCCVQPGTLCTACIGLAGPLMFQVDIAGVLPYYAPVDNWDNMNGTFFSVMDDPAFPCVWSSDGPDDGAYPGIMSTDMYGTRRYVHVRTGCLSPTSCDLRVYATRGGGGTGSGPEAQFVKTFSGPFNCLDPAGWDLTFDPSYSDDIGWVDFSGPPTCHVTPVLS